jgi:hypothetical protein
MPTPNFVPYFGAECQMAVVSQGSPPSSWELAAELASVQTALAAMADPRSGSGPFRTEQVEEGRASGWLGYDLDEAGTRELANATRAYVGLGTTNPVLTLRVPNAAGLEQSLQQALTRILAGTSEPASALAEVQQNWTNLAAAIPEFRAIVRKSAGLE